MKPRPPRWTPADVAYLRANVATRSHAEIAAALGRTVKSVQSYAKAHGIVTRTFWTADDDAAIRARFRKEPTRALAAALGRTDRAVWQRARILGLSVPQRFKAPDMLAFIKEKNALGWSDSEIAAARRVDRHAVSHVRRRLGLPLNKASAHVRAKVAEKTKEQLKRAGLPSIGYLRVEAFKKRAREAGWPEDLRPRAVQMLNALWDRGPMTRRQLADAIGMPWKGSRKSLVSNDPEGSYLAHLIKRGLVISLGRIARVTGKGPGRSCQVYSLPLSIERKVAS